MSSSILTQFPVMNVLSVIGLALVIFGIGRTWWVSRVFNAYTAADDLMREWQRCHPLIRIDDHPNGRVLVEKRNALWGKYQRINGCRKGTPLGFLWSLIH